MAAPSELGPRAFPGETDETTRYALEQVLVRAYTLRWLNGYADLMWARMLENLHGLQALHVDNVYGPEAETGDVDLFFWSFLLRGSVRPIRTFISEHLPRPSLSSSDSGGEDGASTAAVRMSPAAIAGEISHVQHANGAFNREIADLLLQAVPDLLAVAQSPRSSARSSTTGRGGDRKETTTTKLYTLLSYAEVSPYPAAFVRGAVSAQEGASRWDELFDALLSRRFGGSNGE